MSAPADLGRHYPGGQAIEVGDCHMGGALGMKTTGESGADASATTGDGDHPVNQLHRHPFSR
jgi:hypothetical protein